jgi:uncharacterized iron-regulated membrane protein
MRLLRAIHKWAGLFFAVLLLLQALTGLVMAYKETLARWTRGTVAVPAGGAHAPLDALLQAIAVRAPHARLDRIVYEADPELPALVRVRPPSGITEVLHLDPYRARILWAGSLWRDPLQLAERLHVALTLGQTGNFILLTEGLALFLMGVSGLVLWWPRPGRWRQALTIHRRPARRMLRDLHLVPGAVVAVFFCISGLTGAMLLGAPAVKLAVSAVLPVAPEIDTRLPPTDIEQPAVTAEQALQTMHARFPETRLRQVRVMEKGRLLFALFVDPNSRNPRAHDAAGVDRLTGTMRVYLEATTAPTGDAVLNWILPIHTGQAYGPLRRPILTVVALALAAMTVTGWLMWLGRPRRRATVATTLVAAD